MNLRRIFAVLITLNLMVFPSGCGQTGETPVTFATLFANPANFDGKHIVIEGYYWQGWETIVLAEELGYFMDSRRALMPGGRTMWVEGGIPKDIYDRLNTQTGPGPEERFGKVRMTGTFHYGGQYGHAGGFNAEITPETVTLLAWTPPG